MAYQIATHGSSGRWSEWRDCQANWMCPIAQTIDEAIEVCRSIKNRGYGVKLQKDGRLILSAPWQEPVKVGHIVGEFDPRATIDNRCASATVFWDDDLNWFAYLLTFDDGRPLTYGRISSANREGSLNDAIQAAIWELALPLTPDDFAVQNNDWVAMWQSRHHEEEGDSNEESSE